MLALHVFLCAPSAAQPPNIVFFLTDDQDQMLGGSFPQTAPGKATPMPKTKNLFEAGGATATNFFIHTPICCPSRAETLTGRYLHNVHTPVAKRECSEAYEGFDDAGNACCMHVDEVLVNNFTMAKYLSAAGYVSGMFGKYLNNCPNTTQLGWTTWFANGGGSYFNTTFSVENVKGLPDAEELKFEDESAIGAAYSTSLIGNYSIAWIKQQAETNPETPFFAYVGFKASHEPFQPAKWYKSHWDPSWPATAPRPPSWNCSMESRAKHHPNIASQSMLTDSVRQCIDDAFQNRWRTLMSVDDAIAQTVATIDELGLASKTYFFYSSDHGFQLGELNLPQDKRNVYDFDTRIHMVARGPGIRPGTLWNAPATNVDIAPTFLTLAGVAPAAIAAAAIDGRSFLHFILPDATDAGLPRSVAASLASDAALREAAARPWRTEVFIHHYRVGAGNYCSDHEGSHHFVDQIDNNFIAVRTMPDSPDGALLYSEFQWSNGTTYGEGNVDFTDVFFHELFNMSTDKWQLHNIYDDVAKENPQLIARLHDRTHQWFDCKGHSGKGGCN